MSKRAAQGEYDKKMLLEEAEASIDEGIRRAATLSIVVGEHVLGLVYQGHKESEDEMYYEEHERLLHGYVMG